MSNSKVPQLNFKAAESTDLTYLATDDGYGWFLDSKVNMRLLRDLFKTSPTIKKQADYDISIDECIGSWFIGDKDGLTTFNLPKSVPESEAEVGFVLEKSSQICGIKAYYGDEIFSSSIINTGSIYGRVKGSSIYLRAIKGGWIIESLYGAWNSIESSSSSSSSSLSSSSYSLSSSLSYSSSSNSSCSSSSSSSYVAYFGFGYPEIDQYEPYLTAYWNLNEESGIRYDSFGDNHLADYAPGPYGYGVGKRGNAVNFSAGGHLTTEPDVISPNNSLAISSWIKFNNIDDISIAVCNNKAYDLKINEDGYFSFNIKQNDGNVIEVNSISMETPLIAEIDEWYHVVMVADGETLYGFVNNELIGVQDYDGTIITASTYTFIAASFKALSNKGGLLDEVSFWNDVIFSDQSKILSFVDSLYNNGDGRFYMELYSSSSSSESLSDSSSCSSSQSFSYSSSYSSSQSFSDSSSYSSSQSFSDSSSSSSSQSFSYSSSCSSSQSFSDSSSYSSSESFSSSSSLSSSSSSSSSSYSYEELNSEEILDIGTSNLYFKFTGDDEESATVIVNSVSFVVKNVSGQIVWDFGGAGEHTFTYIDEEIIRTANEYQFNIVWKGYGSFLISIENMTLLNTKYRLCETIEPDQEKEIPKIHYNSQEECDANELYIKEIAKKPNVVMAFAGTKKVNNVDTGIPCVIVGVTHKVSKEELKEEDLIPKQLSTGTAVDIIQVDQISVYDSCKDGDTGACYPHGEKYRPLVGGISGCWEEGGACTIGAIVKDSSDNSLVALTNNHCVGLKYDPEYEKPYDLTYFVLNWGGSGPHYHWVFMSSGDALSLIEDPDSTIDIISEDSSTGASHTHTVTYQYVDSEITAINISSNHSHNNQLWHDGDGANISVDGFNMLQPSPGDGGTVSDLFGTVKRAIALKFGGSSVASNFVDGAIVSTNINEISSEILDINELSYPFSNKDEYENNIEIIKSARTTGSTPPPVATVSNKNVAITVNYGDEGDYNKAYFTNQIQISSTTRHGQGGDSGGVVLAEIDGVKKIIGLNFAGNSTGTLSFSNPIEDVSAELNIEEWNGDIVVSYNESESISFNNKCYYRLENTIEPITHIVGNEFDSCEDCESYYQSSSSSSSNSSDSLSSSSNLSYSESSISSESSSSSSSESLSSSSSSESSSSESLSSSSESLSSSSSSESLSSSSESLSSLSSSESLSSSSSSESLSSSSESLSFSSSSSEHTYYTVYNNGNIVTNNGNIVINTFIYSSSSSSSSSSLSSSDSLSSSSSSSA